MQKWKREQIFVKNVIQANCCHKNRSRTLFTAISPKQALSEEICDNCGKLLLVLRFKPTSPTLLTVGMQYNIRKEKLV